MRVPVQLYLRVKLPDRSYPFLKAAMQYVFNNAMSGHSGVYVEARYRNQAAGDYMGSLTANDSRWGRMVAATRPGVGGCGYVYLKCEVDSNLFPTESEIKITVKGKPVYDPRTGTTAYSENPALIIADLITDPTSV